MAGRVQRVEHVGVFSALMQSIRNVVGGAAMFFIAFPLMFWNECSSVETAKSLTEGAGLVVDVSADAVDPGHEGALVHVAGEARTSEILSDDAFGVSLNALKLSRSVEMYQWEQKSQSKTEGSKKTTTYDYTQTWSSSAIDSSRFEEPAGHTNPGAIPYEAGSWLARDVKLGAFSLSSAQLADLPAGEVFRPEVSGHTLHDSYIYMGADPTRPAIGDVRIRYTALKPGVVSVVAQQSGQSFTPYQTKAGKKISMIKVGSHPAEEMFADAQSANVVGTWVLRFVAFMMVFVGLNLILGPLRVVADRVPFVGRIFGAGLSLVTFFIAAALTMVTVALAWIVARPLLGIVLMLIGMGATAGAGLLF